jgi:kinesin family protein 6/9
MAEHKINVFLRLRPTKKGLAPYELVDDGAGVVIEVPKDNLSTEVVNNSKERHEYRFAKVFDRDARQEEVFSLVALPTIQSALDGFNGTIFAYGQTGSGKTFTITGGPEKYEDRGIIPRTLSHIFNEFRKRSDFSYQMHVSYLEIYNNDGYDLLDPTLEDQAKALEDLPKVILQVTPAPLLLLILLVRLRLLVLLLVLLLLLLLLLLLCRRTKMPTST